MPQIITPKPPDFPVGSPWIIAILAIAWIVSAWKSRDGSTAASSGNLLEALDDTPENDDPPDSSA